MNILFLTWKDIKHPNKWWAEKVMHEYAKWLIKKGHNITWFASWFEWGSSEEIIDSIKIIRKFNINTIYFLVIFWYLKYKKSNKIDLIIDEAGWIPLLSPIYEFKIPILFFIHHIWDREWDEKFSFPFNKIFKFLFHQVLKLYKNKKTITVSESTKNELVRDFWFKEKNVNIIENSLDLMPIDKIDFEKKEKVILFLWRLVPIKRVEDSIKAFNEFYKNNKDYKLNIVWVEQNKDYVLTLKKLVKELSLEKNVIFCWFNKEIFEKNLLTSKVLLVPSYKEWFWLVVLEWNSFWLPSIWYDVSGLRDSIKDWKNWFLVKAWDYKWMWKKLDYLIKNEELYRELSLNSLNHVKNLDSRESKIDELEKVICEFKI
jgi:glycosyltransferase involved in cell wall biosynthesis